MIGAGHGWGLAVFPLGAAAIAVAFGATLAGRFVRTRRPQEGLWAVALAMYAAASFAMFLGVVRSWHPTDYRVFWLFGAILNVPFLAQGELYLLASRRVAHAALGVLAASSVAAAVITWTARVSPAPLAHVLPLGKDAWARDAAAYQLRWFSWIGYVALIGGIVWSARGLRGKPGLRHVAAGILWIAVGATVVAIGSGVGAGLGVVPLFSVGLAAGVGVMFWGFLLASRPVHREPSTPVPRA